VSSLSNQRPEAGPRTHTEAADLPAAARSLLRKLEDWSTVLHHGSGSLEFGGLSTDTDGNGKRHRVSYFDTVDSVLVRARHADGRALVAVWLRRAGHKGWKLDMAWRGRMAGELAPKEIKARELTAYVADQQFKAAA
jgi:hypothetical protein